MLPANINQISFVFETCDSHTFDFQHFGKFRIDGITSSYVMRGNIELTHTFSTFVISLHHSANVIIDEKRTTIFEKIIKNDNITWLVIKSTEENSTQSLELLAPWNYKYEYNNPYQKSYINRRGDLFIVISKEKIDMKQYGIEDIDDEYYFDKFACEDLKKENDNLKKQLKDLKEEKELDRNYDNYSHHQLVP